MSDLPPAVATWRDQIERLSEHASPCLYLTPTRWAAMSAARYATRIAVLDKPSCSIERLDIG